MATELQTEDSLIKNFITVPENMGGLGYSSVSKNQVNRDYLLIPSIIRESIINHSSNKDKFKEVVDEIYFGDYREVDGLQLPHHMQIQHALRSYGVFRISEFEFEVAEKE